MQLANRKCLAQQSFSVALAMLNYQRVFVMIDRVHAWLYLAIFSCFQVFNHSVTRRERFGDTNWVSQPQLKHELSIIWELYPHGPYYGYLRNMFHWRENLHRKRRFFPWNLVLKCQGWDDHGTTTTSQTRRQSPWFFLANVYLPTILNLLYIYIHIHILCIYIYIICIYRERDCILYI